MAKQKLKIKDLKAMKLKRFITEKESEQLKSIINNENLISNEAYTRINRDDLTGIDRKDFDFISNLLNEVIVEFSNFKAVVSGDIFSFRFEYNWNYETDQISFIGVGYIDINTLKNGF